MSELENLGIWAHAEKQRIAADEHEAFQLFAAAIDETFRSATDEVWRRASLSGGPSHQPIHALTNREVATAAPALASSVEGAGAWRARPASPPALKALMMVILGGLIVGVLLFVFVTVLAEPTTTPSPEQGYAPYAESGPRDEQAATYVTMHDMTAICQDQYGEPAASAAVVPSPPDPPAWWVKCFNSVGENIGGVDLDRFCVETYGLARSANRDLEAAEAWNTWYCTST